MNEYQRFLLLQKRATQVAPSAENKFFDNPTKKSVREFAESGALSNDPKITESALEQTDETAKCISDSKKDTLLAPPPPEEIRKKPGGKQLSTLNQFVVDTEEDIKKVPKGFKQAPKSEEIIPESEKTKADIKREVVKKVMRRMGYDQRR
jgi:hypothetical protein